MTADAETSINNSLRVATNILQAASRYPSVKRVVYTSSSAALYLPGINGTPEQIVTQWTWNDQSVGYVQALIDSGKSDPGFRLGVHDEYMIYGASRTLAEKAVWEWVDEHDPHYTVNVVIPSTTFGRPLEGSKYSSRAHFLPTFFQCETGEDEAYQITQNIHPQYFIDVQDAARLHVAALIAPDVKNERLLGFSESFNWNAVLNIWRQGFPGRVFPRDVEYRGSGWDDTDATEAQQRAESIMKSVGYYGFEVSLERSLLKAVEGLR